MKLLVPLYIYPIRDGELGELRSLKLIEALGCHMIFHIYRSTRTTIGQNTNKKAIRKSHRLQSACLRSCSSLNVLSLPAGVMAQFFSVSSEAFTRACCDYTGYAGCFIGV